MLNPTVEIKLVSRIFRAGPKSKNRALLHKDFRKPKSVVRINKDTNEIKLEDVLVSIQKDLKEIRDDIQKDLKEIRGVAE